VNFKAVKNTATIEDEFIKQKKTAFPDPKGDKVESINYSNKMEILNQRVEREVKEELIEKGLFYQNSEEIIDEFFKNNSICPFEENVKEESIRR
jgi:aspartyl/asparaginyl-tRNA synthetase